MDRYDFTTQRLFVNTPLTGGRSLAVDRGQANYLLNVLRLKDGANVLVFNGADGEWLAAIRPEGRKACSLELIRQTRPQPAPYDLAYCFAPLKQARLDYMIQKAVEMGTGTLQPVLTHHTQVNRLNLERIRSNAVEAAEQCGILSIPHCRDMVKLETMLAEWDETRILVFADETASEAGPLTGLESARGKPLALLIGPEGGFSPTERDLLHSKSYVLPISLGPRILRADTAAVAALAVVQAAIGDWSS
jgi:16S rRNA (uracil1498-N3)-methyltransferase